MIRVGTHLGIFCCLISQVSVLLLSSFDIWLFSQLVSIYSFGCLFLFHSLLPSLSIYIFFDLSVPYNVCNCDLFILISFDFQIIINVFLCLFSNNFQRHLFFTFHFPCSMLVSHHCEVCISGGSRQIE